MRRAGLPGSLTPWRIGGWSLAAFLLVLPALAMIFTREVAWGAEDFAAAAVLLGGAGLALESTARFVTVRAVRVVVGLAVLGGVALIWAELAVGILPD